jgi:hypothetical protein
MGLIVHAAHAAARHSRDRLIVITKAIRCMKGGIVHIRSGEQYGTATQIPTEEATYAAKKVVAYFDGGTLIKYDTLPVYGITKDNVDQFATGCSY